ncbi:MAG TPA: YceD family protein [Steroidobacteraceae bacterium]|nr:YceD family protein [Steroidobacteraceae bacterium]
MCASKPRDVRKLADSRAVFELSLALAELPGLPAEYLAGAAQVHARLCFGREQGYAMAQVELQTQLGATCQRCLAPMQLRIDARSPVLIVESAQQAEQAPAGWETFLAPEGRLMLEALAAEELLLALPIVPLHAPPARCQPLAPRVAIEPPATLRAMEAAGVTQAATARPFAELRALLERGRRE